MPHRGNVLYMFLAMAGAGTWLEAEIMGRPKRQTQQLDLFSYRRPAPRPLLPPVAVEVPPQELADDRLLAELETAGVTRIRGLMAEAARRRLAGAVPILGSLCTRLAGYGSDRVFPEQVLALDALAAIGGRQATEVVAALLSRSVIEGPSLAAALSAAVALGCRVPPDRLALYLKQDDPRVRAAACRCVRPPAPDLAAVLSELAASVDPRVATPAVLALGRLGHKEARPRLLALLGDDPAPDVIEAVAPVADDTVIVMLGQIARAMPALADAALEALEAIDQPRARQVLRGLVPTRH